MVANTLPSICFCKKQERDCRPDEEALRSTTHRYFYEIDCLLTPQRKDTCLLQAALTALTQLFLNLEIKSREKLMQLPPVITLLPGEGLKADLLPSRARFLVTYEFHLPEIDGGDGCRALLPTLTRMEKELCAPTGLSLQYLTLGQGRQGLCLHDRYVR